MGALSNEPIVYHVDCTFDSFDSFQEKKQNADVISNRPPTLEVYTSPNIARDSQIKTKMALKEEMYTNIRNYT